MLLFNNFRLLTLTLLMKSGVWFTMIPTVSPFLLTFQISKFMQISESYIIVQLQNNSSRISWNRPNEVQSSRYIDTAKEIRTRWISQIVSGKKSLNQHRKYVIMQDCSTGRIQKQHGFMKKERLNHTLQGSQWKYSSGERSAKMWFFQILNFFCRLYCIVLTRQFYSLSCILQCNCVIVVPKYSFARWWNRFRIHVEIYL